MLLSQPNKDLHRTALGENRPRQLSYFFGNSTARGAIDRSTPLEKTDLPNRATVVCFTSSCQTLCLNFGAAGGTPFTTFLFFPKTLSTVHDVGFPCSSSAYVRVFPDRCASDTAQWSDARSCPPHGVVSDACVLDDPMSFLSWFLYVVVANLPSRELTSSRTPQPTLSFHKNWPKSSSMRRRLIRRKNPNF